MKKIALLLGAGYLSSSIAAEPVKVPAQSSKTKAKETANYQLEEMTIRDSAVKTPDKFRLFPNTSKATPKFTIDALDVKTRTNATTVEDVVRYAPSVLIRKRYIGDPNGTLGIRTSNSFQTAHSMVFGDGMPLHNPLRTSFNGAPRWSMVAPSEIESADVLYGPFSAQYSGNSMGGVIQLNTKMPEKFEAEFDATGIFQNVHRSGRNETLSGFKTFLSGGDRFDKFSIWASYNHLDNEGQPMTINAAGTTALLPTAKAQAALPVVIGGENYQLPTAVPAVAYGDIGIAQTKTDLFKMKMGYDFTPDLQGRFTIAYEERVNKVTDPNSLLRNPDGTINWGGATAAGATASSNYFNPLFNQNMVVPGSVFGVSSADRQALNYGLSLKGKISENWRIDTTASYYDAFKDRTISSNLNPASPNNKNLGKVVDEKPWWATYDLKLATDKFFGRDDLSFMGGYQFNHASLNLKTYNSSNYTTGLTNSNAFIASNAATADGLTNDSGGSTQMNSVFSQFDWRFMKDWSLMAGARYDNWQANNGHIYDFTNTNKAIGIQNYANRDAGRVSPKASLEYHPDAWTFRYSFSKAYRFPIAEEMFLSQSSFNSKSVPFPGLGPEAGYFHNFMVQYDIPRGFVRANFFADTINNEINSTTQTINGFTTTTFLPIRQTQAFGGDITFQQNEIFKLPVDFMINGTFMDKHISKNPNNPTLVGNQWDRIPRRQVNGSLTYHTLPSWDNSVSVRYRSNSYQTLTNLDIANRVMGGTDGSTFVDLKTVYRLPSYNGLKSTVSGGIDNVFNVNAFENHPYPQRTYFVSVSLKY